MFRKVIRETSFSREMEFRIDKFGIYFLAYEYKPDPFSGEGKLEATLQAGISYQYPLWFMNWITGQDMSKSCVATNSFNFFVYND